MGEELVLEEYVAPELIDEDEILQAKVESVRLETTKMTDRDTGEPVKQFVFKFAIESEPYKSENRKLFGRTSTVFSTHENCRLRAWVTEILAADSLPPKFRLDTDNLVGNPCRVVVGVDTYPNKNAPMLEDGTYPMRSSNKVKEVIRARGFTPRADAALPEEEPF